MKIYEYDTAGLLVGSSIIKKPAEGESLPESTTDVTPPEIGEGYLVRFNGSDWTIENDRLLA
jgi:hypothetical protein